MFLAQLATLEVENFLSVSGPLRFDFAALPSGVWYICGPNGSGKSLLLEALTWGLFDRTLRGGDGGDGLGGKGGRNSLSLDEVVRRGSAPGTTARVRVAFANGYAFTRSHALGKAGSRLRIETPSGALVSKATAKHDQKALELLLGGLDYPRWSSSVMLSSAANSFLSAPAEQRRTVVEELLGFGSFDKALDRCKEKKQEAQTAQERAQDAHQRGVESLEAAQRNATETTAARDAKRAAGEDAAARLLKAQEACAKAATTRTDADAAQSEAGSNRAALEEKVRDLQRQMTALRDGSDIEQISALRLAKEAAQNKLRAAVQQRLDSCRLEQRSLEDAAAARVTEAHWPRQKQPWRAPSRPSRPLAPHCHRCSPPWPPQTCTCACTPTGSLR